MTTVTLPRRRTNPGAALPSVAPGVAITYLSLIVLLPLAALLWQTKKGGFHAFWQAISQPDAVAALELTLVASLLVAVINAVFGTLIAWVLVRDSFPGKNIVNSLIDLPFALPTVVAGLTLLTLYGPYSPIGLNITYTRIAVVLALLFETLPFVIRSVQPVLLEFDTDMEDAAASLGARGHTVFRRIVLPNLLPAILSGMALAFARAIGEYGSVVDPVRQHPVLDRGRLGAHLLPDRERLRHRRGGDVGRAARDLTRGAHVDHRPAAMEVEA